VNPNDKTAAEKHAAAAREALKATEEGIAALVTKGARLDRAEPFITAAVAGLAARNVAHVPENFAAEAVRLGLAVDLLMAKLDGEESARVGDVVVKTRDGERISPPALADEDELEKLTRPGA
jgi:hypothetical protein